jgi:diguanylate cyclase (GGDEF)-like protein
MNSKEIKHQKSFAQRLILLFPLSLEKEFIDFYLKRNLTQLRRSVIIGWALYSVFGILDRVIYSEFIKEFWLIRYAILSPLAIGFYIYLRLNKKPSDIFIQSFYSLIIFIAGLGLITMLVITSEDKTQPYFEGIMLTIFYAYIFTGLRFYFATASALAITLCYFLALSYSLYLPVPLQINNTFGLLAANMVGIFGSYSMESYIRRDFLQSRQLESERSKLKKENVELTIQSRIDPLTNLLNRRAFEETLANEIKRAERHEYPLSLLILDIDNFKLYNDIYGHLKGDECLKKVASVLLKYARRAGDTVARYGGEEFVILLPGTSINVTEDIAERIRQEIELMKILHIGNPPINVVSVSIGGISLIPSKELKEDDIIRAADEAMYTAKRDGKNRVVIVGQLLK